jgi:thiamine pyrophosphate-dependent acetolactate synthase large subunit-like protein
MSFTTSDLVVETVEKAGVRGVYGLPGDSLNGLTALRRNGNLAREHVRHEEAAAFAAAAEAAIMGELAVCAASCGPGNLHLINGLFDAHRSRVPVLAIAAHIPTSKIGTNYFQETHPLELFRECSAYCELVSTPAQFAFILATAVRTPQQLHLPVKVVVSNNGSLGFVELEMKAAGLVNYGTDLTDPDFAAVAQALGMHGQRVERPEDLAGALRAAFDHDGCALVDVVTARQELSLPPTITLEQIKGFTLYATRSVLSGRGDELIDLAKTNVTRRLFCEQRTRFRHRSSPRRRCGGRRGRHGRDGPRAVPALPPRGRQGVPRAVGARGRRDELGRGVGS